MGFRTWWLTARSRPIVRRGPLQVQHPGIIVPPEAANTLARRALEPIARARVLSNTL